MPESPYRGRFAPSPTGLVHLGTARSALLGWLRARSSGGVFVLRVEDIDQPRVRPGAQERMIEDLRWLGLDWDEGPDVGGELGPYVQSARLERYRAVLEELSAEGATYACTCSRKEIAQIASAPHGEEPVYPGTCRAGPTKEGRDAAIRLRMAEPPPTFTDRFKRDLPPGLGRGDFVLYRKDGVVSYQLACAVDDHDMRITEVLRGDDLLSSTPRQLAIFDALGWERPGYLHVPLMLGPDGERLAKRHRAAPIADLRAAGFSPQEVVGLLASSAGLRADNSPCEVTELVADFEVRRISPIPSKLDPAGLTKR